MSKQVINTDDVDYAKNRLRTVNDNIDRALGELANKSKQLESNWKSSSGDAAQIAMRELLKGNEVRSLVICNYVNILEKQINPGYIEAETVNAKLSDQFK